jgi:hypothetical protein
MNSEPVIKPASLYPCNLTQRNMTGRKTMESACDTKNRNAGSEGMNAL